MRQPSLEDAETLLVPDPVEPNISETKDSHMEPSAPYPQMDVPSGGHDVPYRR